MWSQIRPSKIDKQHAYVTGLINDNFYYKHIVPIHNFKNDLKTGNKTRKHIIILHEATSHHLLNDSFAQYLIKKNPHDFLISLPDLRGHGLSTGIRGHLKSFHELSFDIIEFIKQCEHLSIERPIIVATGFSALLLIKLYQIYNFEVKKYIGGMVLVNPLLGLSHFGFPQKLISNKLLSPLLRTVKIPYEFRGEFFSRDNDWIAKYNGDPLVNNHLTFSFLEQTIKESHEIMNASYFIDVPTFTLASDESRFMNLRFFELFIKGIDKKYLTHAHFKNHAHDLLNDLFKDKVFDDIYSWIQLIKKG